MRSFFYIFVLVFWAESLKLPNYFTKCNIRDSYLNDCVLKNIQDNWKTIIEGDNTYHIQKLYPIFVPIIRIKVDDNLYGNITNGYIHGLNTTKFLSAKLDIKNKHWEFTYSPEVNYVQGNYDVKGRFLGLPITGTGVGKVTFYGGEYTYKLDYNLIERNGKQYIRIHKSFIDYDFGNVKGLNFEIHFDRSSIGKILSDALNASWKEVGHDMADSVSVAIANLYSMILNDFFSRIPYDELFSNE